MIHFIKYFDDFFANATVILNYLDSKAQNYKDNSIHYLELTIYVPMFLHRTDNNFNTAVAQV